MHNPAQTYDERHAARADVELSFAVVAGFFARKRRLFLLVFATVFVAGCLYLGTREDKYMARAVFMPPVETANERNALSSGISGLLGGGVGGDTPPEFRQFVSSFSSMRLANDLARDDRVMRSAFEDQWDERARSWRPPNTVTHGIVRWVRQLMGRRGWHRPTAFELRDYIERSIAIEQMPESQFWEISFEHNDPEFARMFLNTAVRSTDNILKRHRAADLLERERFLRGRIANEQNAVVHAATYQLLSSILSSQVQMQGGQYYAISMLDPVYVLPDPVSPRPSQVIVLSTFLGLSIAVLVILLMGLLRFVRKLPRSVDA